MDKDKFLKLLKKELRTLPYEERENAMQYYTEHLNEAQDTQAAMSALPHPSVIAQELMDEFGVEKKKDLSIAMIILLVLSAPITVPLVVAIFSVIISLIVTLFSLALVPLIIAVTFIATGIASAVISFSGFMHSPETGVLFVGLAFTLLSLGGLLGVLFVIYSKALILLIKNTCTKVYRHFRPAVVKKEENI